MTKATDVTAAIHERLQGILTANGFLTDVGNNVVRGAIYSMPVPELLPVVALYSASDAEATPGSGRTTRRHSRNYVIEALFIPPPGAFVDELQDNILYDLRRALSDRNGMTLGGAAIQISTGTAVLDDPEIGGQVAIVRLPVTADYTENYPL